MIEVPAAITISGILACVASGAAASAAGVTPKPAMKLTLSLTISSCARRLVLSGTARVVLQDDFDLLAGDGIAVLLHVELDRVVDLLAGRGLAAGHRQDQADLDGLLGVSRRERQHPGDGACGQQHVTANRHEHLSP